MGGTLSATCTAGAGLAPALNGAGALSATAYQYAQSPFTLSGSGLLVPTVSQIYQASPPAAESFITTTSPSNVDTGSFRLGMIYNPVVPGVITGARFWRDTASGYTSRQLQLFNVTSHTLLATSNPTSEGSTFNGWVTATFPTPIAVSAGQQVAILFPDSSANPYNLTPPTSQHPAEATFVTSCYDPTVTGTSYPGVIDALPGYNRMADLVFLPAAVPLSGNGALSAAVVAMPGVTPALSGSGVLSAAVTGTVPVVFDANGAGFTGSGSHNWTQNITGNCVIVLLIAGNTSPVTVTAGGVSVPSLITPLAGGNIAGAVGYLHAYGLRGATVPNGSAVAMTCGGLSSAGSGISLSARNVGSIGTPQTTTGTNNPSVSVTSTTANDIVAHIFGGGSGSFSAYNKTSLYNVGGSAFVNWATQFGYATGGSGLTIGATYSGGWASVAIPLLHA